MALVGAIFFLSGVYSVFLYVIVLCSDPGGRAGVDKEAGGQLKFFV